MLKLLLNTFKFQFLSDEMLAFWYKIILLFAIFIKKEYLLTKNRIKIGLIISLNYKL